MRRAALLVPIMTLTVTALTIMMSLVRTGPAVASRAAAAGSPACVLQDGRLTEISGLAATPSGYVVVNDGSDLADRRRIFFLDRSCRVVRSVAYPSRPRDTEDLAVARDGTVWVADIGDNNHNRDTVALWRLARGGKRPILHRLRYPDSAHDAEALVLTGDGTPVIVTKEFGGASLYAPAGPLRAGGTVELTEVGQVDLPSTITRNPFGSIGRRMITGGATSPDGTRVVLRTYADAFEFDVVGGDVVKAITAGEPRVVPLPDEPQGEAITYDTDGRTLLTVSESSDRPDYTPTLLRYPAPGAPSVAPAASPTSATRAPSGGPLAAVPATPESAAPASAATDRRDVTDPGEPLTPDRGLLLGVALVAIVVPLVGAAVAVRLSRRRGL